MVQTLNYSARCSLLNGINLKRETDFRTYPWNWNTIHQKAPSFALHSDHMRIWRCPRFVITASKMQYSWHLLHYLVLECYRVTLNEVHCIYCQGYFLHMTMLIWLAIIRSKHQRERCRILQTVQMAMVANNKWHWRCLTRICEKFRQPITRSNLDYVFMQMYDKGFQMCILQFYISYRSWYLFTAYLLITGLIKHWDIMLHTFFPYILLNTTCINNYLMKTDEP
jgi:hypothetical protein